MLERKKLPMLWFEGKESLRKVVKKQHREIDLNQTKVRVIKCLRVQEIKVKEESVKMLQDRNAHLLNAHKLEKEKNNTRDTRTCVVLK